MFQSKEVYWVFEDLYDTTPVKIHKGSCGNVKRKGNAKTTYWHGPFDFQTAQELAKKLSKTNGWQRANCCMR